MIKASEVDFPRVESKPIYFSYNPYKFVHKSTQAPLHQALIDPKTGHVYSIPSNKYRLLKHEDYLKIIEDVLISLDLGDFERSVVFYNNGAKMKACYRMMDLYYEVGKLDVVYPAIIVTNGYDLDWGCGLDMCAMRHSNELVIGENLINIPKRYLINFNMEKIGEYIIGALSPGFDDVIERWNLWKKVNVTLDMYEIIIEQMQFTRKERDEVDNMIDDASSIKIEDLKMKTISYWKLFNVMMEYISHCVNGYRKEELIKQARRIY